MRSIWLMTLMLLFGCAVNQKTTTIHPYSGIEKGCGNFIVYKLSADNSEYVSVLFNTLDVELVQKQSFMIGKAEVIEVKRKKFAGDVSNTLCNDSQIQKPQELLEEIATEGIVQINITPNELKNVEKKEGYKTTIVLRKVLFESMTIDYLVIEDVFVGWLPG